MWLYGLMITKDDHDVFDEWCCSQLALYDAVVCLDGSESDGTAAIAGRYSDRLVYLHERDFEIPHKTDHGLRAVVHAEIVRRFGTDHWVMCCHADEFCYHDPRTIAALAEASGYDSVSWLTPHFYPHPSELPDWPARRHLPVTEQFRHYHWSYFGDGWPWAEDRLYKNGPGVAWDGVTHMNVRPRGVEKLAPFHPILRHYKVVSLDLDRYQRAGHATLYRGHWVGQEHRTGVSFAVERVEDFFVAAAPKYTRCSRFDGTFAHTWNMGEEFRPGAGGRTPLFPPFVRGDGRPALAPAAGAADGAPASPCEGGARGDDPSTILRGATAPPPHPPRPQGGGTGPRPPPLTPPSQGGENCPPRHPRW